MAGGGWTYTQVPDIQREGCPRILMPEQPFNKMMVKFTPPGKGFQARPAGKREMPSFILLMISIDSIN